MKQLVNKKYSKIFTHQFRYVLLIGGRSAGRSFVVSQFILANLKAPAYFRCAIMRLVLSDIRNSIYQEIIDRAEEQDTLEDIDTSENPLRIRYGKNVINGLGFRKSSGDQKSKLKSLANYGVIAIEEADETNEDDFMQLDDSLRTTKSPITVFLMLNPPSKNHWIIKRWFYLEPSGIDGYYKLKLKKKHEHNTLFIHTTYKDNIENISEGTVENFKEYKTTKPDHYYNMICGLVSEGNRGRIFKNWKRITSDEYDELPYEEYYGLDFGFTNDPTALTGIKEHNDDVYFDELIYETGLTNQMLSKRMKEVGLDKKTAVIYADNAEPKSIAELEKEGWTVKPSLKGADSIRVGVDMLLDKTVHYTDDSENWDKENQEYVWALDKNKEPTNSPVDKYNHLMDAGRYGVYTRSNREFLGFA